MVQIMLSPGEIITVIILKYNSFQVRFQAYISNPEFREASAINVKTAENTLSVKALFDIVEIGGTFEDSMVFLQKMAVLVSL